MTGKRMKSWWVAALVAAVVVLPAVAQQPGQKEMSPEEKAMMEAWAKAVSPRTVYFSGILELFCSGGGA